MRTMNISKIAGSIAASNAIAGVRERIEARIAAVQHGPMHVHEEMYLRGLHDALTDLEPSHPQSALPDLINHLEDGAEAVRQADDSFFRLCEGFGLQLPSQGNYD